jgi:Glycosyl transferase family 2
MFDDPVGAGVALFPLPSSGLAAPIRPGFVVAIPVKDEEERLPACLRALAQQVDRSGQPIPPTLVRVVLFANNCTDQSASLGRSLGDIWSLDIRVVEASLPPGGAHAGAARRAAMDFAETWLGEGSEKDGVILTTDADSQVAPSWIAENLAAFEAGAEAVLGRINLDGEGKFLPDALHRRCELEDRYERLLTELSWLLDPLEHNPWPHHATISGASLGISRRAYCRVGRLPRVPLGEDKALIALLSRQDARIRYSPTIHVITSGRTNGRAPGGVADTLAIRSREPDAFCDDALEPFHTAFARALWRGGYADCMLQGVLRWIKIGRLSLDLRPEKRRGHRQRIPIRYSVEHHRGTKLAVCASIASGQPNCQGRSQSPVVRWPFSAGSGARQDIQTKLSISVSLPDDVTRSHLFDEKSDGLVATQRIIRRARPMDQDHRAVWSQGTRNARGEAADILAAQIVDNLRRS